MKILRYYNKERLLHDFVLIHYFCILVILLYTTDMTEDNKRKEQKLVAAWELSLSMLIKVIMWEILYNTKKYNHSLVLYINSVIINCWKSSWWAFSHCRPTWEFSYLTSYGINGENGKQMKKEVGNGEDSWQYNHMVQKLQIKFFKICDISDSKVQLFWVNNSRILLTKEPCICVAFSHISHKH